MATQQDAEIACAAKFRAFLENLSVVNEYSDAVSYIPSKLGVYGVTEKELNAQVRDLAVQYLEARKCPGEYLCRLVNLVSYSVLIAQRDQLKSCCGSTNVPDEFNTLALYHTMTGNEQLEKREAREGIEPPIFSSCSLPVIVDFHHAWFIQSSRDMGYCSSLASMATSYYAVFDGHAGINAATYSATHVHAHIVASPSYHLDLASAVKEAFLKTDTDFYERKLDSGSTAAVALVRGPQLVVAWVGDSQVLLLHDDWTPTALVDPHKPERRDERIRIEELGGTILYIGTWRVNGQLSVSRALGDPSYKPYVSADPDLSCRQLTGNELGLILGCDGLFDHVNPDDIVECARTTLLKGALVGGVNEGMPIPGIPLGVRVLFPGTEPRFTAPSCCQSQSQTRLSEQRRDKGGILLQLVTLSRKTIWSSERIKRDPLLLLLRLRISSTFWLGELPAKYQAGRANSLPSTKWEGWAELGWEEYQSLLLTLPALKDNEWSYIFPVDAGEVRPLDGRDESSPPPPTPS
ncbi:unnamed protein product [Cyprideis torosa]|uniref:Uncharacterized protein n=1 Tax=Cyprideis torosa TaxID=163714 RepID=A0A7R8WCS6_9CRUS|nr:unnamed protein product [Cyprideis torosa]CAG0893861.1 unnamed protein product [Cyprideis torosa]